MIGPSSCPRQRGFARHPLRDAAAPEVPPLNPNGFGAVSADYLLEHGGVVHDQYELAGLFGRVHDVPLHADGGARPSTTSSRPRRASRSRWRSSAARAREVEGNRELRSTVSGDPVGAAAVFVSRGALLRLPRRGAELQADVAVKTLEGSAQKIPQGPVASQEAIKSSGPTAAGSNANSAHPYEPDAGATSCSSS